MNKELVKTIVIIALSICLVVFGVENYVLRQQLKVLHSTIDTAKKAQAVVLEAKEVGSKAKAFIADKLKKKDVAD